MRTWIKAFHEWGVHWATTKWGVWALFLCAFADASFLPLPTPMFFLTLTLLNIKNAYKYALFGTTGLLFGALAGYFTGHFAWLDAEGNFSGVARFMFNNIPGFSATAYNDIHLLFEKWDIWILLFASFMPLPYYIFSISSGVFDVNLFVFLITTFVGQGIRFYLMAFLIIKLGPEVKKIFEFKLKPMAIMVIVCMALAIIVVKVL
jgi:membrane protein YqaA with SNARE-associated domain